MTRSNRSKELVIPLFFLIVSCKEGFGVAGFAAAGVGVAVVVATLALAAIGAALTPNPLRAGVAVGFGAVVGAAFGGAALEALGLSNKD